MSELKKYNKAIVTAVAMSLATVVAIVRGDEPDSIPGTTEALIGVITTILVFVVPNISE